ncbi:hypothetical protein [Massilia pseudoviolaceinigra]|uniref:hypothetical protein n=1 Tax=Massilia pseudoviolaceinigra TaxID=3057165 RepID=UPI0027963EF1|nr:hypothetical protein [Massilia sp. CCM 9206]MDQ1921625.1 hypothetical protein [Massilia sp. CCM 9206]
MTNAQNATALNTAQTIAAMDFDISNFTAPAAQVTFKVPVLFDDDGEPTHGFIIVGKNSDEHRAEWAAIRAEGQKRSAKRKTAIDATTDEGSQQLVGLIDGNNKRLAIAVTVGWYGFTSAGAPAPFNKSLVEAAFNKYPTWQDRVQHAMDEDANFLKLSSLASSTMPATNSAD